LDFWFENKPSGNPALHYLHTNRKAQWFRWSKEKQKVQKLSLFGIEKCLKCIHVYVPMDMLLTASFMR
jgi:hypothetical protein